MPHEGKGTENCLILFVENNNDETLSNIMFTSEQMSILLLDFNMLGGYVQIGKSLFPLSVEISSTTSYYNEISKKLH